MDTGPIQEFIDYTYHDEGHKPPKEQLIKAIDVFQKLNFHIALGMIQDSSPFRINFNKRKDLTSSEKNEFITQLKEIIKDKARKEIQGKKLKKELKIVRKPSADLSNLTKKEKRALRKKTKNTLNTPNTVKLGSNCHFFCTF